MKRTHRTAHRYLWIVLAVLIATGLTMALVQRKPPKKKTTDSGPIITVPVVPS